jgi:hypothetical protein
MTFRWRSPQTMKKERLHERRNVKNTMDAMRVMR